MWTPPTTLPTIAQMVKAADATVSGLDEAKRALALSLRWHMQEAANGRTYASRNPHVLLIGPTGGGKSHLVEAMLEAAGLIHVTVNATQYSEVGYAGLDLAQIFRGFWSPRWLGDEMIEGPKGTPVRPERRHIVPVAQRWGVAVIDEIDKWAFQPKLTERQPQRTLQAELLRFVENETVYVKDRDSEVGTPFATDHILFIGIGAFQSLGKLVDYSDPTARRDVGPADVAKYGFLEELAGRFSTMVVLPPLTVPNLISVLRGTVYPDFVQRAEDDGLILQVTDAALNRIAEMAASGSFGGIGARALAPILKENLTRAWVKARPGQTVFLDVDMIPSGATLLEAA